MWVHPFDREDASADMLLLARACLLVNGASTRTPVGVDIDAPEWAWAAIEAARQRFPGFRWDTMMCTAWQEEKSSLARAEAADQADKADLERADLRQQLSPVIDNKDWAALMDMGVTLDQIRDAAEGHPEHEHWVRRVKAAERNRELAITRTGLIAPTPTPNKSMRMR